MAFLFGLLDAFLSPHILALLLGEWNALLLLLDAAGLLWELLARLVAAFGHGNLHLLADLSTRMANVLLYILADFLGLVPALVLPDRAADLLLVALLFLLLILLFEDLLEDLLDDGTLPLLVFLVLGLGASLYPLALFFLDLLANLLVVSLALVLQDRFAFIWTCVTLGLPFDMAVGAAGLLELHLAERNGNFDALVLFDQLALFLFDIVALLVPYGLAVVDPLVLALIMICSVANLMSNFVEHFSTLQNFLVLFLFLRVWPSFRKDSIQPQQSAGKGKSVMRSWP